MTSRILVVDDEPKYVRVVKINLEARGYTVLTAADGQTAVELAASAGPHLVLLDIRLPDLDGYQVCRRIREFSAAPVIMLTALGETTDKIKGLDSGADDYITKPFSAEELLARVRAVLRRSDSAGRTEAQPVYQAGDLRLEAVHGRVFLGNREIGLTSTEYHLLYELIKQAGRVLTHEYLLERVWGVGYEGDDHLVWKEIHRVRRKIEPDPQRPQYIHSKPGIGYLLAYHP